MTGRKPTRILLIGCGKAKQTENKLWPAKDLYTGPIFKARREFAERSGFAWFIASAAHGLLPPDKELLPYDYTLKGQPPHVRAGWALQLVSDLLETFTTGGKLHDVCVELHMGEDYADYLTQIIPAIGMNVHWATKGMSQGEQLAWYKSRRKLAALGVRT